jgi:hypothetical protein
MGLYVIEAMLRYYINEIEKTAQRVFTSSNTDNGK